MSITRRDLRKLKLRRERIRKEKAAQRNPAPPPGPAKPFAAERALRQIHALIAGHKFTSAEQANAKLMELTADGRLEERAKAWFGDDPKWRAQELAYEALETDDLMEALRLALEATKLDPDCTDAQRLLVSLAPSDRETRIRLMREVVEKAETSFGQAYFEENTGRFWGVVETRPYMRAKLHLGELLRDDGQNEEAIAVFERMLELCAEDNLGVRYQLLSLYLQSERPGRATELLSKFENSISATVLWARVLDRWLNGRLDEAAEALSIAREINPFVEKYLSGKKRLLGPPPDYYRPGDETEAQVCASEIGAAWERHAGAREWLRAQGAK